MVVRQEERFHDGRGVEMRMGEHETESGFESEDSRVLLQKDRRHVTSSLWHSQRRIDW